MDNYKKYFRLVLKKYFPEKWATLQMAIDSDFVSMEPHIRFAKHSKNPVDRRLVFAGYFLSTIKILEKEYVEFEKIKQIVIEIALEYVKPKSKLHLFFKKLPALLIGSKLGDIFIGIFKKKVQKRAHPDGFVVNILANKAEILGYDYGFDIIECGICKLYNKLGYEKYASILCEVDHITSNLAGLTLIRTGTIANGAKKCDFRFQKRADTNFTN